MADQPRNIEITYPIAGIDTSAEFGSQRPGTTPDAENVRAYDPLEERERGGPRHGSTKYPNDHIDVPSGKPIQHLQQVVVYDPNYMLTSFENWTANFTPDDSSNNFPDGNPPGSVPSGEGGRNPERDIPPDGSGVQPQRSRPASVRRRVQLSASVPTQKNGSSVVLTSNLLGMTGRTPTGPIIGLVTLTTYPSGRSGDGAFMTTSGGGTAPFTVQENNYEGPVVYYVTNLYVDSVGNSASCRGTTQVIWKPNYVLSLVSPDGYQFDNDGKAHPLNGTLTNGATGQAIPGRILKLGTTPTGRTGDRIRIYTDDSGNTTWDVADSKSETVAYKVSLIPKPPTTAPSVTQTVSIQWGDPSIAFVQTVRSVFAGPVASPQNDVVVITAAVNKGELIVICHIFGSFLNPAVPINPASITDSLGTTYALAVSKLAFNTLVSIFYGIAPASGSNSITLPTSSSSGTLDERDVETSVYTAPAASPLQATNSASQSGLGGALVTKTPGAVATSAGGIVVTAQLTSANTVLAVAGPAGTNPTANLRNGSIPIGVFNFTDLVDCILGTATPDVTCKMNAYVGIAASFKP